MEVRSRTRGVPAKGKNNPPRRAADARIHPYAGETAASVCFGLSSTSRTSRFPWCRQRRGTLTATSLMLQLCRLLGVWGEWLVCKIALPLLTRR